MTAGGIGLLTLNVGSPSRERAERQLAWLDERDEDIFVLTETANNQGSVLLRDRLSFAGWDVRAPLPTDAERGVLVASRIRLDKVEPVQTPEMLGARVVGVHLEGAATEVIGVYVPSRDSSDAKTQRKRRFVDAFLKAVRPGVARTSVVLGDLNVVEPDHRPRRPEFFDWEFALYEDLAHSLGWVDAYRLIRPDGRDHSWVSHDDEGYRFDHAFVTSDLAERVTACGYVHDTRSLGLSDHSALSLRIAGSHPESLDVAESISRDPGALF